MNNTLRCGAAIGDITPMPEELPGLEALQRRTFGGVLDPLHVRAITLNNGEEHVVIVCYELDKAPYPLEYSREISERFGIAEEGIFMLAVHAHAVPITGDRKYDGPNNIDQKPEYVKKATHAYEKRIHDILMDTVGNALASEERVKVGWGRGKSYINVDRRSKYIYQDEKGKEHTVIAVGADPTKEIDHTVTVLRMDRADGTPAAFLVNYPVHCTVMHGNTAWGGRMGISSDIAGRISMNMERAFPGSVCIWTSGAAGNINPLMQCELDYPDPVTGKPVMEYMPGNVKGLLNTMAGIHFRDVLSVAEKIECSEESVTIRNRSGLCVSEGKEGSYEVRLHMMRFGNMAILAPSGELYSSYAVRLMERIGTNHLMIISHDCSNAYNTGYIIDPETLEEGECELPGSGDRGNIRPEKFLPVFLNYAEKMYGSLFAD